ncbi:MAG TPA: hypothetical protein GXZ31_02050 [Thermoanaerobacterales bacterium]|nr:hypothetical protein [Thermoanaerobacterales bacterium]
MDIKDLQAQQIQPGPCPPEGCPPFNRIECIVVDKVYDSCFQMEERTRETEITMGDEWLTGPFAVGTPVSCALQAGKTIECDVISKTAVGNGFFTISLLITIPIALANPNDPTEIANRNFNFTKAVTLCAPDEVEIDCSESTLMQCTCVITGVDDDTVEVTCDLQICVVVKSILTVQLLVPSYGFCVPAPCQVLPGVCPPLPPPQCL